MSTIGGGIGALNNVASFAGAQRTEADTDRNKEVAAERKFQVDRAADMHQTLGDVSDPDLSPDRDADGRLPYNLADPETELTADEEQADTELRSATRSRDAFGERGNMLDLEA